MNRENDINKLIKQAELENYEDYQNYNDADDEELDDTIIKYCIKKKFERDKQNYDHERYEFFDPDKTQEPFDINAIEHDANFWKKIKTKILGK